MSNSISTWWAEPGKGYAVVSRVGSNEMLVVDYYDNQKRHFFCEEFPGKDVSYVEDAAENWALGIKKLEDVA